MRRNLPNGAEATMVMVGDIDILHKPIFVFVRLAEATFMYNVTEVGKIYRKWRILRKIESDPVFNLLKLGFYMST